MTQEPPPSYELPRFENGRQQQIITPPYSGHTNDEERHIHNINDFLQAKVFPAQRLFANAILGLSIVQLIAGVICVIIGIVSLAVKRDPYSYWNDSIRVGVGCGLWSGVMFNVTGIIGIVTAKKKTMGLIVTLLILSIVSAVTTIAGIHLGTFEVIAAEYYYSDYSDYGYYHTANHIDHIVTGAILIAMSGIDGIIAIICASFTCHGLNGCCCKASQPVIVYYTTPPGQDVPPMVNQQVPPHDLQYQQIIAAAPPRPENRVCYVNVSAPLADHRVF